MNQPEQSIQLTPAQTAALADLLARAHVVQLTQFDDGAVLVDTTPGQSALHGWTIGLEGEVVPVDP